ncbi:exopolysaccharide production protein ExoF [Thioclava sp. ES.031]|uniref:polysaccharide biosynthesis/export family protein n=1 Tax=Thioclava sp. ES.031 TaxID=1798203 RepID=UPI000C012DBB|nr:polysaccharide biosynthesis/export family protein [Thioclava sp. ES.031]PFG63449.1 exopolysaccharide production protein ExoF [Thioclava sp. ES.031]
MKLRLALILGMVLPASAGFSETIVAGDALSIRVMAWDPISAVMREWDSWPTEYTVDEQGILTMPFLGPMKAETTTPSDLSEEIANRLIQQLGITDMPGVSVAIAQRPPVYVSGLVRTGGKVDFREGMTAREALAQAGGIPMAGLSETDPLRARLEAETLLSDLRQKEDTLGARRARLIAEVDGAETIDFPPLQNDASGEVLRDRERKIFELDREETKRRITLIDGRLELLNSEIAALEKKSASLEEQQALAQKQTDAMNTLADRGLAANARLLDAQRVAATVETQALDVRSAILKARQDIASAEADRLDAVEGAAAARLETLRQVEADLDEIRGKRVLQERIVGLLTAIERPEDALQVRVHRKGANDAEVLAMDAPLMPGDIVEFQLLPAQVKG